MFQFEVEEETSLDGKSSTDSCGHNISFAVGDRVNVLGDMGVVKYIGSVEGYAGVWLGVEWDDKSRGKHDGTLGGVLYFHCPFVKGASFVKVGKVHKVRNILEALKARYDPVILPTIKSIEDRLQKKAISYSELKVINLGGMKIDDLSGWEEFVSSCPNVQVIELSDNFISNWKPFLQILKAWPRLRQFDMSRNPLFPPSLEDTLPYKDSFPQLECVVLGGVCYDWETLLILSNLWPQITTLTVPFNKMSILTTPSSTLLNITSLDLEKNNINDWTTVLQLGDLQRLEYLNLCGNHISKIYFPNSTQFQKLTRFNISENLIDNWVSISELNKVKSLEELRMDINPVLNHFDRPTNRQIIIARIEHLKKLEGVEIQRQERRDAELDYVKLYGKEWSDVNQRDSFLSHHPLYQQLSKKYGQSDSPVEEKKSIKSTLINLVIVPESSIAYKECEKKILKTMTVQKLKALLQRVFKLPPVPVYITATSCRNPEISFQLDNDFVEVGQYSLEDGDTLRIRW